MEIIVKTATRGATITPNLHNKPDVGVAFQLLPVATPSLEIFSTFP
jgi:hypothetical protein